MQILYSVICTLYLQALHTWVWAVSLIVPLFLADPLKLSQIVWGVSVSWHLQDFLQMVYRIQVWALAGLLKYIQRLIPCLGCVILVIILLKDDPCLPSLRFYALCCIHP